MKKLTLIGTLGFMAYFAINQDHIAKERAEELQAECAQAFSEAQNSDDNDAVISFWEKCEDDIELTPQILTTVSTAIETKLKTVPASDYDENLKWYGELAQISPSNEEYGNKIAYYEANKKRKERVEQCFSAWDGSHRGVVDVLMAGLRDPDSYEHISTRYGDDGENHISVRMNYRARNGFGGMNIGEVVARAHIDKCDEVVIISSEQWFAANVFDTAPVRRILLPATTSVKTGSCTG